MDVYIGLCNDRNRSCHCDWTHRWDCNVECDLRNFRRERRRVDLNEDFQWENRHVCLVSLEHAIERSVSSEEREFSDIFEWKISSYIDVWFYISHTSKFSSHHQSILFFIIVSLTGFSLSSNSSLLINNCRHSWIVHELLLRGNGIERSQNISKVIDWYWQWVHSRVLFNWPAKISKQHRYQTIGQTARRGYWPAMGLSS